MSISVVIIDDEPKAIDLLKNYVDQVDELEIKETFREPYKAFHYLTTNKIDLLFLDINMPQLSGLELFQNLKDKPSVIFTTAHAKYAINGFDLQAIDYLLKPITLPRFLKSIQKYKKVNSSSDLEHYLPQDPVFIKSGSAKYQFFWSDVKFLHKSENYVIYHLMNGQRILSRGTLSDVEKLFPSYIIRVHKSYAVCLYNITMIESTQISINETKIPIGRKYKDAFHARYDEFRKRSIG